MAFCIVITALALCHTPASELQAAMADLRGLPPDVRRDVRYLSLYNLEPALWSEASGVVSFVLNSLSRSATIVRPQPVPGAGGRLLRWSPVDYGLEANVYESLAGEDPYWHLRTKVIDPASGPAKGTTKSAVREVYTDGGWLDLATAAELRSQSGSGGALLRADFFIARAATTANGGYYYRFAGVPENEAEFFELLGLDLAVINRLEANGGANLLRSGVTHKLRRIARRQGPLGGAWQTYDVERNTADRDPIRNPFSFRFDAGEHIAAKANGLHLFALYDRQGRRQESVPDRIAKDGSDPLGDGIIVPLVSCVRCHVEDGLRPFGNDQKRLLAGNVELYAERPADARRLAAFYEDDLDKQLRRDREDYAAAVAAATGGSDAAQVAVALAELYRNYADELVTPEQAARELGVPPDELACRLTAAIDPVILALCEGLAVQRGQWETAFGEAALLGAGFGKDEREEK